jgi:hypothetical protein
MDDKQLLAAARDEIIEGRLPLEIAENKMFSKLFSKFDTGEYDECREIIDLMERLSIV